MAERTRHRQADADLIPVERLEDIPRFKNEDEEAAFWATHSFGEGMRRHVRTVAPDDPDLPPPRAETLSRPIAVRFDEDALKRLRTVAAQKHIGYQTLLKAFVLERLYEEEKREGLIA